MTDKGSYFVAEASLVTIKYLISQAEWNSAKELMTLLKQEGKQLVTKGFYFNSELIFKRLEYRKFQNRTSLLVV